MASTSIKPVITLPIALVRAAEKVRKRQLERSVAFMKKYGVDKRHTPLLISCRDMSKNYFERQKYPDGQAVLVTELWTKAKSEGDYFTVRVRGKSPAKPLDPAQRFDQTCGISDSIVKVLHEINLQTMSIIQQMAFEPIFNGRSVAMIADSGSGKSLAFLTPVISRLMTSRSDRGPTPANHPRTLLIAPTWELVEQHFELIKRLTSDSPLRTEISRCGSGSVYPLSLDEPGLDILAATPGAVAYYRKMGVLNLEKVDHVIIDEADTMLDDSFCSESMRAIAGLRFDSQSDHRSQLILASSCAPASLNCLEPIIPSSELLHLTTDTVHRLQPHLEHRFLRISKALEPEALLTHVKNDYRRKSPVLIFTTNTEVCQWLRNFLQNCGLPCVSLHSAMNATQRLQVFRRISSGEASIVVATDLLSLGLDTCHYQHVINYQMPINIAGYLRRAGRVGRLHSSGSSSVTSFITEQREIEFVKELENTVRNGLPLANLHVPVRRWKDEYHE